MPTWMIWLVLHLSMTDPRWQPFSLHVRILGERVGVPLLENCLMPPAKLLPPAGRMWHIVYWRDKTCSRIAHSSALFSTSFLPWILLMHQSYPMLVPLALNVTLRPKHVPALFVVKHTGEVNKSYRLHKQCNCKSASPVIHSLLCTLLCTIYASQQHVIMG